MPTKLKASAPDGAAEVSATEAKPKTPRRRASPKRKAAPAKTARSGQPKAQAVTSRSKAAMVKLQSAVDQLEAALQEQAAEAAAVPSPPVVAPPPDSKPAPMLVEAPVLAPPAPRRPEVEVAPEVWSSAIKPALATGALLVFVATLIVGYSTGYAVGTDSVDDPMILVASAAEKPVVSRTQTALPSTSTPKEPRSKPIAEAKPSPVYEPAPVPVAATSETSSGLHLQVSALKSLEAATALGARLENEGYPVKVREPEADGLVRVLVGPVSDSDQLSVMANRLREEGLKPFPKRL